MAHPSHKLEPYTQTERNTMFDDWNMNDALAPDDRTYVRIKPWDTDEELCILAKSLDTNDKSKIIMTDEGIEGAYVLEGTDAPEGYTEIRTTNGRRWLVRNADIEVVPAREIAFKKALEEWAREDQQTAVENTVLALETPEVRHVLSNMVRQYVIRFLDSEKTKSQMFYK